MESLLFLYSTNEGQESRVGHHVCVYTTCTTCVCVCVCACIGAYFFPSTSMCEMCSSIVSCVV